MFKTINCALLVLALFLVACGGPPTPIPSNTAAPTETPAVPTVAIVEPALLHQVNTKPAGLTLAVTEEQQITATALDQLGNPMSGLNFVFRSDERAGTINGDGKFTAGVKAGNYPGAVTVEVSQGSVTKMAIVDITIQHGPPDQVLLGPEIVELEIGESQDFSVEVVDVHGNPVSEAQITWEVVDEVGNMGDDGFLTTGTRAGTFAEGIKVVANLDDVSVEATVSVTVNPGPPASLSIPLVEVAAGAAQQLSVFVADQYDNLLEEAQVTWTVNDINAGSITPSGLLTAGEVAGSFEAAIEAQAVEGDLSATTSVDIIPGPLEQVVIAPDPTEIGMGMRQQFVAVGADMFGNRISGLEFIWSVGDVGGKINAKGLFTAGSRPGNYNRTIKASAIQGEVTRSDTASVIVEPDRIAFVSARGATVPEIYIMNIDGSSVRRITGGIGFTRPLWSPDGRRLTFSNSVEDHPQNGSLTLINDDGSWGVTILQGPGNYEPAWSPDGTKIAYQKWESDSFDSTEIYVMDVDGGNQTRLTNNSDPDDFPSWSPDGSKIVFQRVVDDFSHIFVMNADGSKQRALTSGANANQLPLWSPDGKQIIYQSTGTELWVIKVINATGGSERQLTPENLGGLVPSWSPDGQKILFHSFRDSDDLADLKGAEIYIMDRRGGNVTRLTENTAWDGAATWAPRKQGVEVSEESVVIPDASATQRLMAQEVTAKVRAGVVRIATDLGAGSGFFIDPDGLILTNNHVISDAETITIFLADGTRYTGTVRGRDLVRDLAVVKIDADDLPTLELGDVGQITLGSDVMVVGFPLGLTGLTTSSGSASSVKYDAGRNITLIQTDSTINPGNSGGPLLNMQGQVIGVVTSKITGGEIEDFGLAVSANTVKLYLKRLKEGEVITS